MTPCCSISAFTLEGVSYVSRISSGVCSRIAADFGFGIGTSYVSSPGTSALDLVEHPPCGDKDPTWRFVCELLLEIVLLDPADSTETVLERLDCGMLYVGSSTTTDVWQKLVDSPALASLGSSGSGRLSRPFGNVLESGKYLDVGTS